MTNRIIVTSDIVEILNGHPTTWFDLLHDYQVQFSGGCGESLGLVNKIYDPPTYGEGAHTNVISSTGDFTLRYTISVTPDEPVLDPGSDPCPNSLFHPVALLQVQVLIPSHLPTL